MEQESLGTIAGGGGRGVFPLQHCKIALQPPRLHLQNSQLLEEKNSTKMAAAGYYFRMVAIYTYYTHVRYHFLYVLMLMCS